MFGVSEIGNSCQFLFYRNSFSYIPVQGVIIYCFTSDCMSDACQESFHPMTFNCIFLRNYKSELHDICNHFFRWTCYNVVWCVFRFIDHYKGQIPVYKLLEDYLVCLKWIKFCKSQVQSCHRMIVPRFWLPQFCQWLTQFCYFAKFRNNRTCRKDQQIFFKDQQVKKDFENYASQV